MKAAASDIIATRLGRPDGMATSLWWSAIAHAGLVLLIAGLPGARFAPAPRVVMTVSLGSAGARTGGLTTMGGQAAPRPTEAPPPRTAPRAAEAARPRPAPPVPRPEPQPAPDATPQGVTRTDTRIRGQGFGLSGGGGSSGTAVQLDVADFCCPEYLEQMVALIQRHWDPKQGVVGTTAMKFTIARDGGIQGIQLERGSGFLALDNAAARALALTERLPPLPPAFPNPTLTVHMRFEYQR
jgi:protein TonB